MGRSTIEDHVAVWDQVWDHHWYSNTSRRKDRANQKVEAIKQALLDNTQYQKRICEIGCGSGHFLAEVSKIFPNLIDVSGCDQSRVAISLASETLKSLPIGQLEVCDAGRTSFPSAYFDTVFIVCVLEHVEDKKSALAELARITKPGGSIVVFYSNSLSCFAWERRLKSIFAKWKFGYQDEIAPEDFKLLIDANFTKEKVGILQGNWDFPLLAFADRLIGRICLNWGRYFFVILRNAT